MRVSLFSSLFLMPLCSLFLSFCIYAVSCQCLGNQQSLLLQLKNTLVFNTALSTKLVHWDQNVNCSLWEGVTCDQRGVIGLDLSNESISGQLDNSSDLSNLRYLQKLNLAYNNFNSSQITYQLAKLKEFELLEFVKYRLCEGHYP
ncbi:Receptor-like protein 12 [Morella rubra]|uniref:Receptor-like protein 12 n=1 Tax=Morella rubra TaxID=262757 RepID=A0A6A1UQZ9_9ROSI|nr:Receptor-like protein 12 [Morella rubra]